MFGAKYQWILAGKYADDWWRGGQGAAAEADIEEESGDDEDERRCSDETLQAALNGYICADILILSLLQQQPTVADLVGYVLLSSRPRYSPMPNLLLHLVPSEIRTKIRRNLIIIIGYNNRLMQLSHCSET